MKRTFERLLFMVIGAFIASFFYIVGCNSNSVSNKMSEKTIECDTLIVRDTVRVGKEEIGTPVVYISADSEVASIVVSTGKHGIRTATNVQIEARGDIGLLGEGSSIMVVSHKGTAGISISDPTKYKQW